MSTHEMWSVGVYDENPVHTRLKVYNYGGLAGTLCVNTSDAPELVARLTTHMRSENVRLREECDEMRSLAVRYADEIDALYTALGAALEALRGAPKPPWNFRPTIDWQGVYCDWYEAQAAIGEGGGNDV